ncbi:hypothetical protein Goshw_004491, partial [Gossypium schwendimanii]|nr:hypothetical protein [Gossypium schwendimanii]
CPAIGDKADTRAASVPASPLTYRSKSKIFLGLSIGLFASYLGDFDSWSVFSHSTYAFSVSYLPAPLFIQAS